MFINTYIKETFYKLKSITLKKPKPRTFSVTFFSSFILKRSRIAKKSLLFSLFLPSKQIGVVNKILFVEAIVPYHFRILNSNFFNR